MPPKAKRKAKPRAKAKAKAKAKGKAGFGAIVPAGGGFAQLLMGLPGGGGLPAISPLPPALAPAPPAAPFPPAPPGGWAGAVAPVIALDQWVDTSVLPGAEHSALVAPGYVLQLLTRNAVGAVDGTMFMVIA